MVMRISVSVPTVEIGADHTVVRDFVHVAEERDYTHLRILDHVLGADPQFHPEVPVFYYTPESVTHEPSTVSGRDHRHRDLSCQRRVYSIDH
jgi:hypothetical protein